MCFTYIWQEGVLEACNAAWRYDSTDYLICGKPIDRLWHTIYVLRQGLSRVPSACPGCHCIRLSSVRSSICTCPSSATSIAVLGRERSLSHELDKANALFDAQPSRHVDCHPDQSLHPHTTPSASNFCRNINSTQLCAALVTMWSGSYRLGKPAAATKAIVLRPKRVLRWTKLATKMTTPATFGSL